MVDAFYKKATTDFLIGYQFRKIASKEFPPTKEKPLLPPIEAFTHHLPRIKAFWENQLMGVPLPPDELSFDLINIHRALLIRRGELNRWILLFQETLNESLMAKEISKELKEKWEEKVLHFQKVFLKTFFT